MTEQEIREARLRAASLAALAALTAAISLLERGGKYVKRAAPSDLMFDQMMIDYRDARDALRKALGPAVAGGPDARPAGGMPFRNSGEF